MDRRSRLAAGRKDAMKSRDVARLATLRLINAAIKDKDIALRGEGEKGGVGDGDVLGILAKMVKQRRDSLEQFEAAGRDDLAKQERFELGLLKVYMPEPLDPEALTSLIGETIKEVGAESMRDMGAVMSAIREQVQGRADMKAVSQAVREQLSA